MSADAILNVTTALRKRFEAALNNPPVSGTVFVGPLDDADVSNAKLILFLYRIVPNANLRNREHTLVTDTPPPTIFRNSLPLDLYFLLTVGTTPGSSEETLLQALGLAMQDMQSNPELSGPDVKHQTVHVSLEPLSTEEASRIWALFPTANYRTSIAYLATPVWIDPAVAEPLAARVTEDALLAGHKVEEAVS